MGTIIRLAGWKAEGLRCPDHEVSFLASGDTPFPITLLQMPNGTGKTTTLELLRATLSGAAEIERWTPQKVRSLSKKGSEASQGIFQVALLYDGRRVTVTMTLDFTEGLVRYSTTVSSGIKDGFHPPREIAKFCHPDFVRFFVFDGELAEQLLSHDHTDAQRVIEDLFQLRLFTEILTRVEGYWEDETANRGATEIRGFSRRANRVATLRQRIAMLKEQQAQMQQQFEATKEELLKQRNRFNAALTQQRELHERFQKAVAALGEATANVQRWAKDLLGRIRNPHALSNVFAAEIVALKSSLDRVKLPESTAREFFEELAEEATCICGSPLNPEQREAIRNRAAQYLGSDSIAMLNALKGDVGDLVGKDAEVHERELLQTIENLNDSCRVENELRAERDSIEGEGVSADPRLEKAKETIHQLEHDLKDLEEKLRKYDDMSEGAGDENTFGIRVLERRLATAERLLAEISHTLILKIKRDYLVQVLERAHEKARMGISEEICREANDRIHQLMPNNAIRIQEVERCLLLQGQEGGSVGETLSVAYAFLATLFNRTEHELPFVVDSPANPIDLRVRTKVAQLIPRLTHQFVAFTISSERQGFLPALEEAATGPIQYITLFRKGVTDLDNTARSLPCATETSDGFCIIDRSFFRDFHLDVEENNHAV